jgi:hypothetical protein
VNTSRKNAQQYMTASSPLLLIGQNPCGRCWVKYATAISPEAMKAAGRVNNPRVIKMPVINSINPESQKSEPVAAAVPAGQPNNRSVPWHRNRSPKKIRNRLRTIGACGLRRVSSRCVMG